MPVLATTETIGTIYKVAGPLIVASGMRDVHLHVVVRVSEHRLIGEIIELRGDLASVQVYEDTSGIGPGEPVYLTGEQLVAELAPGLIEGIFDGIERPLTEIYKIEGDRIVNATKPAFTAQCLRVPVSDGHTAAVFVDFDRKPSKEEMIARWAAFSARPQELNLPSAPKQFLHYFEEDNFPQAKLHRDLEGGMAVSIGRLREDTQYDYKFVCLSHNTLRGAAGGAVLMAELLCAEGYLD